MANTLEFIASSTVGSGGAADITFSSITADWKDLAIYLSARQSRSETSSNTRIEFNGSSSNLSCRYLQGIGYLAVSGNSGSYIFGKSPANTATSNSFGNSLIYIPNAFGSNNKSVSWDSVTETNATGAEMFMTAGLWSNSAAITSIKLSSLSSDNFMQYTTAYLYGIKSS